MSFGAPRRRIGELQALANYTDYASLYRPERGSFPLDHDGECKHIISGYLKCIKLNRGTNDEACRKLAKEYLSCRMDKNLMAPDNFQNLGLVFKDDEGKEKAPANARADASNTAQPKS
ncbi:hypothetical protein N7485_005954 [Penicillium canescens]|nr:hypothetical protein N7485_005954 [Penicillium canescens]